jgi:rubrerythrin
MTELNDFYNHGSDWICKRCETELAVDADPDKHSKPTSAALAKWMDNTRRVLICPRCGLTESVEKS